MLQTPAEVRSVLDRALGLDDAGLDACRAVRLPGLTNRTYRASTPIGEFVVRLPGPGLGVALDRFAEAANATLASAIGVGPPVVWCDPPSGVMVTPWLGGYRTACRVDLTRMESLSLVAGSLRRLHDSGVVFTGKIDLTAQILRHARLAASRLAAASLTIGELERLVTAPAAALAASGPPCRPCHNDPSPGNWLLRADAALLVDWEYSAMNDPAWDLACLAAEAGLEPEQDRCLVQLYQEGPAGAAQLARHQLLRVMADLLAGLWFAAQAALTSSETIAPAHAADRLSGAVAFLRDARIGSTLAMLADRRRARPRGSRATRRRAE